MVSALQLDLSTALARELVKGDIARLERSGTPDPQRARTSLALARLLELLDDEPSESVSWLVDYLSNCEGAGSR